MIKVTEDMVLAYQQATLGLSTCSSQTIRKGLEAALSRNSLIDAIDKLDDTYDTCGDRSIRSDDLRWYEIGFNAARDEIVRLLEK